MTDKLTTELKNQNTATISNLKKQLKNQSYQLDRMEQYTRRDNIRIKGVDYSTNENTNDIVINLAKDIGVELSSNDISTSHRLGATREVTKPSTIIVRFAKRDKKVELLKNKKKLRSGVYFEEDLTKLRRNMAYEIRKDSNTTKTWKLMRKSTLWFEKATLK